MKEKNLGMDGREEISNSGHNVWWWSNDHWGQLLTTTMIKDWALRTNGKCVEIY